MQATGQRATKKPIAVNPNRGFGLWALR